MESIVTPIYEKRKNFQIDKSVLCLIPMKSIDKAKSRLRKSFPEQYQSVITEIIIKLFKNTVNTLKEVYNISIVSPSEEILDIGIASDASFVYQDNGLDLNDALTTSINYAAHLKKWKSILILTADLPFLSHETINDFVNCIERDKILIIPSPKKKDGTSKGTSGLFIPIELWPKIELQFGVDSYKNFITLFNEAKIEYFSYEKAIGFDLDDIEDLNYLKSFKKSNQFINELYSNIQSFIKH